MSKVALVTGGTGGLGRAIAEEIATKGFRVIVSGRNVAKGEDTVNAIRSKGGEAFFLPCDLHSEPAIRELHEKLVAEHGRLDAAVNCAGIATGTNWFHEMKLSDFTHLMQVNVTAVFVGMQEQIKIMLKQGGGHIINLSSIYGTEGTPLGASYCASKHAVNGLTKTAAVEYAAKNIMVNCLSPGVVPTGMIDVLVAEGQKMEGFDKFDMLSQYPAGRFGTTDQVAKAAAYLLDTNWTTGANLTMDGGFLAGKALPAGFAPS